MSEPLKPRATGQIDIRVRSDSMFLTEALPFEVRDSRMKLVARGERNRTLDLAEGLYEVSAVLEDGRRHRTLVQVRGGQRTPVEVVPTGEDEAPETSEPTETSLASYRRPRFTRSMVETEPAGDLASVSNAVLRNVRCATLERQTRTLWTFRCEQVVKAVPTAVFEIDGRSLEISLPISPGNFTPSSSCAVRIERRLTGVHAGAWIAPERTVANALQNMLSAGYVLEAARVADDAVSLLRDKYDDPAGAALGALLLYKVGRLQPLQSWVENLAMDFSWLPDGKVLLAQLLLDSGFTQGRALQLVLQASDQRMLYSEAYSLCLELLRRLPGERTNEARQKAIDRMAGAAPYVDWESVCLSQWVPSERE